MKKLLTFFLTALLTFSVGWAATVTDVLNQSWTGITGTSYSGFSGKAAPTSNAVYAGNCAGSNSSIQLRSNNNNSGIVTTTSGGKVKSITVNWSASTAPGRTLNVYVKNSAYSAATDLYNSSTQGTLLGTIVCGTSTSLTVSGDYEYIGFRSASGAMYLLEVSIVWETSGSTTTVAAPTISPNGGNFATSQVVTLSHDDADAAIYYTTNGVEPTTSSTLYTSPFTIYETTTVKAIAVKNGVSSSPATATFTNIGVGTIADAYNLAQGSQFIFTGNAVVTYQYGRNVWIRDNSGSGLIYRISSETGSFTNGDILDAGWAATNTTYSSIPEFNNASGVTSSSNGGTVAPVDMTSTGITSTDVNKYVSLSNVTLSWDYSVGYCYVTIGGNTVYFRDYFNNGLSVTSNHTYDIEGIAYIYGGNNYVYLTKVTEIVTGDPLLEVNPSTLTINDSGTNNTFTVEGSYLGTDNVGLTQSGSNFTPSLSATTGSATNGGTYWYFTPAGGSLNGTVAMDYNGRELSASETVSLGNNSGASATVTVNYVADLYIVTDNGVTNDWHFDGAYGEHMTNNNGVYTATFTAENPNTFILFARKLGDGVTWNTRYVFGPSSGGDWWLPIGGNGNGTIDVNTSNPIKIQEAGTYIITINANDGTFTITKEVVNEGDFVLVTDDSQLNTGDEVIFVNKDTQGDWLAMSTTQNNNNRGTTDVTVSPTLKVTATDETQIATLEGDATGWYFNVGNGYLYAASSGSNYLRTRTERGDDNAKARITINNNVASIVFQGANTRNVMQFNGTLVSCYGSANQSPVYLYRREASAPEPSITVNPTSLDLVIPVGESSVSGNVTVTETNTTGTTSVSINGDTNIFSATLENGTLTVTYNGNATMTSPDVATITLTNGDATATVNVTGYKLPMTVTITPADGHTFSTSTVTGLIESNVADALIEYSFDGTTWYTYDFNDGFTTPEVSTIGGTVTVYARATKNGETATAQATYTHVAPSTNCTADIVFAPTSNNGGVTTWSTLMDHMSAGTDYISDASMATVYTYMDYDAFRFGSGNNVGHMTFTLDPSKFTGGAVKLTKVTVNAARYRDDTNCELKVSTDVNTTGQTQSITASQTNFADYVFNFDGSEITTLTLANLTAGSRVIVHSISLEYECTSGPATPHISPESGTFSEDQEVEITCTSQGATIYYTINGGEPQVYTDKFNVDLDEDHTSVTIVAWAEKDGEISNQATVTYTYKKDHVSSIAEFLALDNGEEAIFDNPVVVLFDYSQNSSGGQEYIWIKDRTGYTQLFITPQFDAASVADPQYNSYGNFVPKYENGDVIPAGFKVKKNYFDNGQYYQGQCTDTHSTFQEADSKALADPEQVTLSELLDHPADYNNRYLYINKLQVSNVSGLNFSVSADENGDNVSEVAGGSAIVGYNKYNSPAWKNKNGEVVGVTLPEDNNYYNVKFIFQKWQGGYEIMPIEFTLWEETSLLLEDLVQVGVEGQPYTISNQLHAVAVTWDGEKNMFAIFAKDDHMYANKSYPTADQESYLIRYENGSFINEVEQKDYDQSNWIEILIPSTFSEVTSKTDVNAYQQKLGELQYDYEGKILKAATVKGTYVNELNPTIQVTQLPQVETSSAYTPNVYCTANFLKDNIDNGALGVDGEYYFMMDAKPHEFCKVVWAYYDNDNGNYFVIPAREGNTINGHGFHGSFMANMSLCEDYQVYYDFNQIRTWFLDSNDESYNGQQTLYGFDAIIRKNPNANNSNGAPRRIQPGTGDFEQTPAYIVYPLNAGGNSNDNVVSVKEVLGNKAIESVHYYNMMGMEGKTPFEGINIVVTRYTDGSTSTYKVMK